MYAIYTRDGSLHWIFNTQGAIDGPPTVAGIDSGEGTKFVAFFGSRDGNLYARDVVQERATQMWQHPTGGVVSSPLVVDSVVYVGSMDGNLYALEGGSGNEVWPPYPTEGRILGSPAYADGILYVGSEDRRLHAVSADDGQRLCVSTELGTITATPVVFGDKVYVGSADGNVWELDAQSCNVSFPYQTDNPVTSSPAISDGVLYIPAERQLLAIELGTNLDVWPAFDDATESIQSSPSIANGVIYVGSDDRNLYAIDVESGKKLWSWQTGGRVVTSPAVADGAVFFGSLDGVIYAVGGS